MIEKLAQDSKLSIWLRVLGVVGMVFGLAFGIPGVQLLFAGGSWFFAIAGLLTVIAGRLIYRGDIRGTYLYLGVWSGAVIWSLWDVRNLETWFWPLIPRLFSFAVALLAVLVLTPLMPSVRGNKPLRLGFLAGAGVVALGILITAFQMFQPHGVVQNAYSHNAANKIMASTQAMGGDWHFYGRTLAGTRFAPAAEITKDNIDRLEVAWTYHTGQFGDATNSDENTPTYANGMVYACTPYNQIHAIDAVTGERKWMFESNSYAPYSWRCRGLSYYEIPGETGACSRRLAMTAGDARLFSIDADTGKPCADFGKDGIVDLKQGLGYIEPGVYMTNSSPAVSHGKIISGALVVDNFKVGEPSGVVRAWDAKTGAFAWAWDVGRPGNNGPLAEGEQWTPYTPNVWTHIAVDEERGLVFLPTGNATPDVGLQHRRPFDHEYTDTIVAVDINTGQERWHFRTTNKDLWDFDLPSQPSLYDLPDPSTGGTIPILVQTTKRGQIFVLNRETGKPVAEVIEKQVITDNPMPGFEDMAKTQPYSVGMPSIGTDPITEADMWGATPIDLAACRLSFKKLRYDGNEFLAPTTEWGLQYPSALGGMNWGSASIDEQRGILFVNDLRMPMQFRLVPKKDLPKHRWPQDGHAEIAPQLGTSYGIERTVPKSIFGLMCKRPPYGTLSAIDLNTRKLLWQRPIGTIANLDFVGLQTGLAMPLGMPTLGGSLSTGSGLLFFAGAMDHKLRVIDSETGNILREIETPVGSITTPMSYIGPDGKQYIVLSNGGASSAVTALRGDNVIAYRLK